jgi:hypothetical protein
VIAALLFHIDVSIHARAYQGSLRASYVLALASAIRSVLRPEVLHG